MPKGPQPFQRAQQTKPFRILQINLNRCRLAQELMVQSAWEMAVDAVIISEPYRQLPEWENDGVGDASIWVTGFSGRFPGVTRNIRTAGIVVADVDETVIVSCYCSPNRRTDFTAYIDEVEEILKEVKIPGKGLILAGDFNAKATVWGGKETDKRGNLLVGLLARQGLDPVRLKGGFTFIRNGGRSLIDVMATDRVSAKRHHRSTVLPTPTESDHCYVLHNFCGRANRPRARHWAPYDVGEVIPEEISMRFQALWEDRLRLGAEAMDPDWSGLLTPVAEELQLALERTTAEVLRKKRTPRGAKRPNQWWSSEISTNRGKMHKARRSFQRARKKGARVGPIVIEEMRTRYKESKKSLQISIWRAKEGSWADLISMVDGDPWGKPFKAVMAKLKGRTPRRAMTVERATMIAEGLFVTTPEEVGGGGYPDRTTTVSAWAPHKVIEKVTPELIMEATRKLKTKKAPGMDMVPAEVVAIVCRDYQELLREAIIDTLRRGAIPPVWRLTRVVLLPKQGKDPANCRAYRPISVLPALSKIWEYAVKALLELELGPDPFHTQQYGFRRGSGTVDATLEVRRFVDNCRSKNRTCALVALDVKNAFNELRWSRIHMELEARGVSLTLRRIVWDYLRDRRLAIHADDGVANLRVTAGVPQGSVLGPFLWNLVYDGILKRVNALDNTEAIPYADDLAVLFTARDVDRLPTLLRRAMEIIRVWFKITGLDIAAEKTEIIFLRGNKAGRIKELEVLGTTVPLGRKLKYLGVVLDNAGNFRPHLEEVMERADKVVAALGSLQPNTRGPSRQSR